MIKMKSRREMRFTRAAPDLRGFIQISSGLRKPPRICIKLFSRNRMECGLVVFATIANSGGRKREAHEQVRGQRFAATANRSPGTSPTQGPIAEKLILDSVSTFNLGTAQREGPTRFCVCGEERFWKSVGR